jgi:hypothetical protein
MEVTDMNMTEKTHDVYFACSERRRAEAVDLAERLRQAGYTVWAWWEEHPKPFLPLLKAYRSYDPEHPFAAKIHDRLMIGKMECCLAILAARCVVLIEPSGNDNHIEAGFAQGRGVPVVVLDAGGPVSLAAGHRVAGGLEEARPGLMSFDWPVARDLDGILSWVHLYAREIPARQAGLGSGEALAVIGQGDGRREIQG